MRMLRVRAGIRAYAYVCVRAGIRTDAYECELRLVQAASRGGHDPCIRAAMQYRMRQLRFLLEVSEAAGSMYPCTESLRCSLFMKILLTRKTDFVCVATMQELGHPRVHLNDLSQIRRFIYHHDENAASWPSRGTQ